MSEPLTIGAPIHGPGGLLATPGLGTRRRKGKRWGMRTKDTQITGRLYRSETGRFSAGNGPSSDAPPAFGKAPKAPKRVRGRKRAAAKPKQTDEQRAQASAAKRATNADAVAKRMAESDTGLSPSGSAALLAFASGTQPTPEQGTGLAQMGLAEQATDGSYRMTPTGRGAVAAMQAGDYQRAVDSISRGTDASGKRAQSLTERTARQQATQARREQTQARRAETAARRAAKKPAKGSGGKSPAQAAPAKTPSPSPPSKRPKRRGSAASGGGGGGGGGSSGAAKPKPAARPVSARAPAKQISPALTTAAQALSAGDPMEPKDVQALVRNGLARLAKDGTAILTAAGLRASHKSFIVYKDHTGRDRWIARTTTAYRDRDGEIISEAALDQDSQRMTASGQFGPLRWWHVGDPDPANTAAPWGIGLDIGDCDYSTVIGRTRVESGTFRDSGIARKVAQATDRLEMSPGFFHPLDQPDAAGVFAAIRTFERSVVPVRYGRASNLFTGFTVKEFRMEVPEMERRFKAMYTELGLTPEQGAELGQQLVQTEKAAQQQGIAFKDNELPDVVINGVTYKAFPPKADTPDALPEVEAKADAPPMEAMVEDVEVDPMAEAPEGDYIGDMSRADFLALMTEAFAPLVKALDISGKMGSQIEELKTMMGGVATKEQGVVSEVAALKARLAEIEGNQPATLLPAELEEAFKSAGPVQTQEPERKQIESTPERPWAGWAAKTFPELYQNGENA